MVWLQKQYSMKSCEHNQMALDHVRFCKGLYTLGPSWRIISTILGWHYWFGWWYFIDTCTYALNAEMGTHKPEQGGTDGGLVHDDDFGGGDTDATGRVGKDGDGDYIDKMLRNIEP